MTGLLNNATYHVSMDEVIDICKRQGLAFESSVDVSIPSGGSLKTVFVTGSKPVVIHSRRVSYDSDGLNAFIYREPVYTGGSVTIEVNNPNDINPQPSQCSFISGATVTNDGIQSRAPVYVYGNTSKQGKGESLELIEDPQIVPPNSEVLFVLGSRDSTGAQQVASIVEWIEPDRIPGIVLDDNGDFVRYSGRQL